MHLLRRDTDGEFSLADYDDRQLPPYAILSHTWGSDNDEVSFKDIVKGRGKEKQGYAKLHFCANQAANDGLEYFWVDTCCIDKKDSVELSKAINSMFSWYQHSTRCYVYLSDVTAPPRTPWKDAFQKSKWFTRGWTLQELLAPSSVEFFTADGERLGDKRTLSLVIHQATAIPSRALETSPLNLSDFSIEERMSWADGRETKREEDAIYSLLGLFDVHMPPIYGEGKSNAFDRLELEIQRKLALDSSRKRSAEEAFEETTLSEESNSKLKQSASDRAQEHSVSMHDWWAEAMARNMGTPRGYAKVAVLLLRWADELDESRTRDEVSELAHVFRERFHFETDVVELNHRSKPQHQMDRVLTTFVETYDQPDNLLIVFYSGYAIHDEDASRLEFSPFLGSSTPRVTTTGGQINWYKTQNFLRSDAVDGDVLAILDTPYPRDGNIRHVSYDYNSNYRTQGTVKQCELITTCSHMACGHKSLTRALIDGLKKLYERNGNSAFSTNDLIQCIKMDPRRSGLSSEMRRLSVSTRHILLAPMNQSGHDTNVLQQQRRRPGRGYLKLGLEIRDASLEQEQIDRLANILSTSLDNQMIGLRGIEWLGFERREKALLSFSENLSLKVRVVAQWRRIIAKRKAERASTAH